MKKHAGNYSAKYTHITNICVLHGMLKNGENWEIIFIFPFKNQGEK